MEKNGGPEILAGRIGNGPLLDLPLHTRPMGCLTGQERHGHSILAAPLLTVFKSTPTATKVYPTCVNLILQRQPDFVHDITDSWDFEFHVVRIINSYAE